MSRDRDAKSVLIIEEDAINCASLAVSQDDGLADQLRLGLVQFAQDKCTEAKSSVARENLAMQGDYSLDPKATRIRDA